MWRYIPGVQKPSSLTTSCPKRLKPTENSDDEGDERCFVQSWTENYPWITYDKEECRMYCSICKQHKKKNTFASSGSTNFRRSALVDHGKSGEHTDALRLSLESKQAAPVFATAIETADNAMLSLLKAAYFIAREDLAILKFEELIKLLERCLCPHLPRELYRNRDGCNELIALITQSLESEFNLILKESPYLGIMIDESTDLSVRKNLLLYINSLNSSGNVDTYFAHISEVKQCDAEGLTWHILEYLDQKHVDISRVAGLGSDGASVMTGKHNGVGAILKRSNPFMLAMHCVAHKLALASENAASAVPYCNHHRSTLKGLYNFFHTSPKNYSALKDMMDILNDQEVHIQQIHTVRWLTIHRAVEAIRKCFPSLLATLSTIATTENDPVAEGLYKAIRAYKFIVFTHFLCDILGDLTYLSCFFQRDNLDFSQVQSAIEGTIDLIKERYVDCDELGGVNLKEILQEIENSLIFEDHTVLRKKSDDQECFSSIRAFASAVIHNLEDRFPNLPVWSSFKIFDPLSYPSKAIQLRGFGEENVDILMDHFGLPKVVDGVEYKEVINPSLFRREWPIFKRCVYDNYRSLTYKECAKEIITKKRTSFPAISKLLEFTLVLPMSSVPCERGFSKHNRIRTKYRQSLTVQTIRSLMFISVNGTDADSFDYTKPLKEWKRSRNRQIYSHAVDIVL